MTSVLIVSERRAREIAPVRIWVGIAAAALFALALAAPLMAARGWAVAESMVRQFFSPVCHQDVMRSFWFWGGPTAVCARCLGIYLGAAVGAFARIERWLAVRVFAALLLANVGDVVSEFLRWHGSLPQVRFALGVMLGVSVSALVASSAQIENPTQTTSA